MQNAQAVTKRSSCVHHFEEFVVRYMSGNHGFIISHFLLVSIRC